jgi:hypothetical protein
MSNKAEIGIRATFAESASSDTVTLMPSLTPAGASTSVNRAG